MSGTKAGGRRAALTNIKNHGKDFYANIGRKGGQKGTGGGFGAGEEGRERARKWGKIGGARGRRKKSV